MTTNTDHAESRAVTALKGYARTDRQTMIVCRAVWLAAQEGVSQRKLAARDDVRGMGFSSQRIGQLSRAYGTLVDTFDATPDESDAAACTLVARLLTAVSGSTSGIPAKTRESMVGSARERGISVAEFTAEVEAEIRDHALSSAGKDSAGKSAPAGDSADGDAGKLGSLDEMAPTLAVTVLQRIQSAIRAGRYSEDERRNVGAAVLALADSITASA